jgi:hypothetical protein
MFFLFLLTWLQEEARKRAEEEARIKAEEEEAARKKAEVCPPT